MPCLRLRQQLPPARLTLASPAVTNPAGCVWLKREVHLDNGTGFPIRPDDHGSAVRCHDFFDDVQAEARVAPVGTRVNRLEQCAELFRWDDGTEAVDGQHTMIERAQRSDFDRRLGRTMLDGIAEQIGERLRNPMRIAFAPQEPARLDLNDAFGMSRADFSDHAMDHEPHIRWLHDDGHGIAESGPGKVE